MPLLQSSKTFAPHEYEWAIKKAVEHEQMHWGAWEARLQEDVIQWKSGFISDVEKNHLTQILRLFTQSDVAVASNYVDLFIPKFKNNDIRHMLMSFANREGEHQRAYALLNRTLGFPDTEFTTFLEYTEMSKKIEFMQEADTSTLSGLGQALAKAAINEGMSLFGAFIMLLNYQRSGKMPGTNEINQWSIRDEECHAEGMTMLFRVFCDEHPRIVTDEFKKSIYEMTRAAIKLEDKFLDLAYSLGEPENLTKQEVKQHLRYLADRRLIGLGFKPNWHIKAPLQWVEPMIAGDKFSNFFERVQTSYSTAGFSGEDWGYPTV